MHDFSDLRLTHYIAHANKHKQTDSYLANIQALIYVTVTYPVRWPQAHRNSWSLLLWETERWRIWRVVDCTDNTERLLLKQVQRLDT